MVDSFFATSTNGKKRKRSSVPRGGRNSKSVRENTPTARDEEITSESEGEGANASDDMSVETASEDEDDHAGETEADKRRRLAKEYLASIQEEVTEDFDAKDLDQEIISRRLKQDVAEQQGKIYRFIGDQLQLHVVSAGEKSVKVYGQKAYSVTSVASHYPHCFTVSKDLTLAKWDISKVGKARLVKTVRGNRKRKADREYQGHVDEILALAVSPDGKLVVTGGKDRKIIVWTRENLTPIKVFDTKDRKGVVTGFAFRRNTNELYVSCADLKVRTYNLSQLAQVETLFGHQDEVADIAALAQERCLTVGSRDRTAIIWKIAEESRLTYRGGEIGSGTKKLNGGGSENEYSKVLEGSIDCCTMLDDTLFVTGSDNGNISLWAANKKKPIFVRRECHGRDEPLSASQVSGETDTSKVVVPAPQPRYITSLYAVPYSDVFFSGSWSGEIKVWKLTEEMRSFELIGTIPGIKGVVNRISVVESGKRGKETFVLYAGIGRELRLGRWLKVQGNNGLAEVVIHKSD
jgi:ribosomal RNA-processing protein 9